MPDSPLDPNVRPGSPSKRGKHFSKLPIIIASGLGLAILFGIVYGGWHRLTQQNQIGEQKQAKVLSGSALDDWFANQPDGFIDADQQPIEKNSPPPPIPKASPHRVETNPTPQPSELEKLYLDYQLGRVKEYLAALESDSQIDTKRQQSTSTTANQDPIRNAKSEISRLQHLLASNLSSVGTLAGSGNGGSRITIGGLAAEEGGNSDFSQDNKLDFLVNTEAQHASYLRGTRTDQIVPFEIKTGTLIAGVMISGLNSDLPGDIIAQVSENVYDTATGQYLLVPQGTKLYGTYDSKVAFGQNRALAVWTRLIYPDGSTLELEGMQGYDQAGYSGYKDRVNNHYWRLFGSIFLVSVIKAVPDLIDNEEDSSINTLQVEFASQTEQAVTAITRKNLQIQPTIEIRPGYKFSIIVNKDIAFKQPYRPYR